MANRRLPTPEELRQLFDYNPETGVITWRRRPADHFCGGKYTPERAAARWNACYAGQPAGCVSATTGYVTIEINYVGVRAHRIAWALHYGLWPEAEIDHIDRDRSNNRIVNLRQATVMQNARNRKRRIDNKSGVSGIFRCEDRDKWRVTIGLGGGKSRCLGYFSRFQDAVRIRRRAEKELGYDPSHGS